MEASENHLLKDMYSIIGLKALPKELFRYMDYFGLSKLQDTEIMIIMHMLIFTSLINIILFILIKNNSLEK